MIEATEFRDAMSLLTTAVNVVTTKGDSGVHGFTASAVCSVTDTPPTLLVCMNQAARSHGYFVDNRIMSVNVLGAQHESISNAFASKLSTQDRFAQGAWTQLVTGSPILEDAVVSFDCEIEHIQEVGTHSVFMCRVVGIKHAEPHDVQQESLVYFNRAYHQVGQVAQVEIA
ncbi:flavin reductase [Psychrobacter sp. DM4]|uniref:flavin reductase n=1 Tax=Psychrobacter sp. DM4 TaxID=3440637 RepID=UPI003F4FD0CC